MAAVAMVRVLRGADAGKALGVLVVVYTLESFNTFADQLASARGCG